jgi:hypothetical protein
MVVVSGAGAVVSDVPGHVTQHAKTAVAAADQYGAIGRQGGHAALIAGESKQGARSEVGRRTSALPDVHSLVGAAGDCCVVIA